MNGDVKITRRTNPIMRSLKAIATLVPLVAVWLVAFTQLLSAIFAGKVFYAGRFTSFHAVTYRDEPTLYVFLVTMSLVIACFFGWAILGLIPKRDRQV